MLVIMTRLISKGDAQNLAFTSPKYAFRRIN
jgi:hypothetical protein